MKKYWAVIPLLVITVHPLTPSATTPLGVHQSANVTFPQPAASSSTSLQPPLVLDLSVIPEDISFSVENGSQAMFGRWVTIDGTIWNLGEPNESSFQFDVGIREISSGYNRTLWNGYQHNAFPNETTNSTWFSYSWNVDVSYPSSYEIWVLLDPLQSVTETNESNNFATIDLIIEPLNWQFSLTTSKTEYAPGESLLVSVLVTYGDSFDPIPNIQPMLEMVDMDSGEAVPGTAIWSWSPSYDGWLSGVLYLPSNIEAGSYGFRMQVMDDWRSASYTIEIKASPKPLIASEVLAFLIAATLAAVLFAAIYVLDSRHLRK